MNTGHSYTPYHPRWHRERVSTWWWLKKGSYLTFILRELSSVFVAWFVVFLLMMAAAVARGPDAYTEFLAWSRRPWVVALNLVSLFFIVYHAVTWFNLAPQAMVVHFRGRKVPGWQIAAGNYAAWAVASLVVVWLLLR